MDSVCSIDEVVTNCDHLRNLKYSPVFPCAFTEHGAIMAASVLNSPKAIEVSVFVVRAFVQLREAITGHKELARKVSQLERKLGDHDDQIMVLIEAIKQADRLSQRLIPTIIVTNAAVDGGVDRFL